MVKTYLVTHYQHLVDKVRYRLDPSSFYKTRVYKHETQLGTPLHDVQVRYSEMDKNILSDWQGVDIVDLKEDGNGSTLTVRSTLDETRQIRLDYSEMLSVMHALVKWHQINGTGMMREIKPKR